MLHRSAVLVIAIFCLVAGATFEGTHAQASQPATRPSATTRPPLGPARWEKQIAAYEAADRESAPPKGGIVFTGSSTILRWKTLASDFPDHAVINRGFGGSQIADAAHFADRIIIPYAPRMVVVRSGGNDLHSGKSAQQVFADYQGFVETIRTKLPDAQIVFIGLAPAPARWADAEANKQLNTLVEDYTKRTPGLKYVETYDTTADANGNPREELFVKDRVHFNAEGYKLLAERVRPALPAPAK